jgi:predicted GNAT superfamily acetyltransferase
LLVGASGGARSHIKGDYCNVVGLAEALRGLRDVARRLVADLLGALEAEKFALVICGLNDTIG